MTISQLLGVVWSAGLRGLQLADPCPHHLLCFLPDTQGHRALWPTLEDSRFGIDLRVRLMFRFLMLSAKSGCSSRKTLRRISMDLRYKGSASVDRPVESSMNARLLAHEEVRSATPISGTRNPRAPYSNTRAVPQMALRTNSATWKRAESCSSGCRLRR